MAIGFELLVENLRNIDFFNFFLPWALILAITYGILQKSKILGESNAVNSVASIALSFLFLGGLLMVLPSDFFPKFFAIFGVVISAILFILLVSGFLGANVQEIIGKNDAAKWIFFIIVAVATIGLLISLFSGFEPILGFFRESSIGEFIATLALIAVFVLVAWIVTKKS
jgi:hypothetical protein